MPLWPLIFRWKWLSATAFRPDSPKPSSATFRTIHAAWLAQSRANRTGKRPVWVHLTCAVCGYSEAVRPKKWWPDFSFVFCGTHRNSELPKLFLGEVRSEYEGVGSRFVGVVDVPENKA